MIQSKNTPFNFEILSEVYDRTFDQHTASRHERILKFLDLIEKDRISNSNGIYYQVEKSGIIRITSPSEPFSIEVMVKNTDNKRELLVDEIQIVSGNFLKTEKIDQILGKYKRKSYYLRLITKILKLIASNRRLKTMDFTFGNTTVNIFRFMLASISSFEDQSKETVIKSNIELILNDFHNSQLNVGDCLTIPVLLRSTSNGKSISLNRKHIVYYGSSLLIHDSLENIWYPGDIHVHSSHSWDGKNLISEMSKKARKIGYSFIVITDHSHSITDDWEDIKEECLRNSDQNFICIRGEEVSCNSFNRPNGGYDFSSSHLLAYNISHHIKSEGPIHNFWPDIPEPQDTIDMIHKQDDGFCFAAHPFGTKSIGYRWNEWNNLPDGLVLWSYVHDGNKEPKKEALEKWQELLNESKVVFGFADSDAHSIEELGHVWNWVLSDSLKPEDILESLKHGKCVFSNGPFSTFYINDGIKWHSIGSNINIRKSGRFKILINWESKEEYGFIDKTDIIINGETFHSIYPNEEKSYKGCILLSFSTTEAKRITIRIETSTKTGKLCYSNPIWLSLN